MPSDIFKAVDCATNEVIGHISLGKIDRKNKTARVGKVLVGYPENRGKGYGAQLMQAILNFTFKELRLQELTLGVFDFNEAAIKCYKKIGFQQERFLKDAVKNGEEGWNLIEMKIVESDWKKVSQ